MRRTLGLLISLLLAAAGGVAAASALTPASTDAISPNQEAVAVSGSDRIGATMRDPKSGPEWAVRSYVGAQGRSCLIAARVDGQQFGPLVDGRIQDLPIDGSGSCDNLDVDRVQLIVDRFAATADTGERTVIFGKAASDITALELVTLGNGQAIPLAGDGTFLVVSDGALTKEQIRIRFTDRTGTVTEREL